jgi:hypothetical protein
MHVCKDRCHEFEIAHRSCAAGSVMRIAQMHGQRNAESEISFKRTSKTVAALV